MAATQRPWPEEKRPQCWLAGQGVAVAVHDGRAAGLQDIAQPAARVDDSARKGVRCGGRALRSRFPGLQAGPSGYWSAEA